MSGPQRQRGAGLKAEDARGACEENLPGVKGLIAGKGDGAAGVENHRSRQIQSIAHDDSGTRVGDHEIPGDSKSIQGVCRVGGEQQPRFGALGDGAVVKSPPFHSPLTSGRVERERLAFEFQRAIEVERASCAHNVTEP